MRIVVWNCNLSLGRKLGPLLALNPDVAVIQECERDLAHPEGYRYLWTGQNARKGLGVLTRDTAAHAEPALREEWTYFFPITLPTMNLRLLAVWAYNHRASKLGGSRTGYVRDAITELAPWLADGRSIVAGDFNNSAVWDRPQDPNSMTEISNQLCALGLRSAYHVATNEALGHESKMTHYHLKNAMKGYHIDYCFAHSELGSVEVTVPDLAAWRQHSDHVPVVTVVRVGDRS